MKFMHINPAAHTVSIVEGKEPKDVYPWPSTLGVDHGVVQRGVGIVAYEYGLLQGDGPYFSIHGQLFSGDAILYGYDERGDTVDMPNGWLPSTLTFYTDREAVEGMISRGSLHRPHAAINGKTTWEWNK